MSTHWPCSNDKSRSDNGNSERERTRRSPTELAMTLLSIFEPGGSVACWAIKGCSGSSSSSGEARCCSQNLPQHRTNSHGRCRKQGRAAPKLVGALQRSSVARCSRLRFPLLCCMPSGRTRCAFAGGGRVLACTRGTKSECANVAERTLPLLYCLRCYLPGKKRRGVISVPESGRMTSGKVILLTQGKTVTKVSTSKGSCPFGA